MKADKIELYAGILLFSVLCVCAAGHFILCGFDKENFAETYSDDSEEGLLVVYSGNITGISLTKTGNHLIIASDNISIFISGGACLESDAADSSVIRCTGTVSYYGGKREISVSSADDVKFY